MSERVPELILTLKTESDERKRAQAAEELREYDARTFTEIVPVLVDVLHNDKKSNVRLEALNSLSRLRPVSQSRCCARIRAEPISCRSPALLPTAIGAITNPAARWKRP